MPDVSSRKFVQIFQAAIAKSGRLSDTDVRALKSAQSGIGNATERAAAEGILSMLRNDKELDSFEVAPTRRALGVLLGKSSGPLPADLEKALKNAVPQANVKVKDYDLAFDFSGAGPEFPGRAVITLDAKAPRQTILEVNESRLTIGKVQADGKDVAFTVKNGRLAVEAPGAKKLDITYTVKPADAKGPAAEAFGLIKDKYTGRMWTLTWPYNTGALFPSNSNPSDGSTSKVTVKVESGTTVVGTGVEANGAFTTSAEAPAYAIAMYAANNFTLGDAGHSKDGVHVTGYGSGDKVPTKIREAYIKTAKDSLDFYAGWLGKFDYGKTLKIVEVDGGLGGMEHTGAVAIMMSSARDPEYSKETAAHETAHHWFGDNLRIKSWGDFWMSEGFTNYATYRFFRADQGEPKYFDLLDKAKGEVRDALSSNPHALSAPAYTDVNEIFDSIPYEMGPWILRMMESELGTEKFDVLLKDWYSSHRQQAVSTKDFVKFAKEKTGHDFGPFFKAWNNITAVPSFQANVKLDGTKVAVTLAASTPVPKGIKIPLLLEGAGQKKTVMVDPTQPLTVDAGFKVSKTTWDPERTVLADVH
ncbi:MAG: M1 family metallopeptidase [Myxococcaceae bacterium]